MNIGTLILELERVISTYDDAERGIALVFKDEWESSFEMPENYQEYLCDVALAFLAGRQHGTA